jgi:hypothetical protein
MNGKKAKFLREISIVNGKLDEKLYKGFKREWRTVALLASQRPKLVEPRKRKPAMSTAAGASQLPRNPLIVIRPVRALISKLLASNRREDGTIAPLSKIQAALLRSTEGAPKHRLDALAA